MFEVESVVSVLLLPVASSASLIAFDVEVELKPKAEKIILIASSYNSSLDELEISQTCARMPVAELLQPDSIATLKHYNNKIEV